MCLSSLCPHVNQLKHKNPSEPASNRAVRLMASFSELFRTTSLSAIIGAKARSNALVSVPPTAAVVDLLKAMSDHKVSSIPVIVPENPDACIAIVDSVDLLNFLVQELKEIEAWVSWSAIKFQDLFSRMTVSEVIRSTCREPLLVASEISSIESIIGFFSSGIGHRCLVRMNQGGLVIVSQFDIINFVNDQLEINRELSSQVSSVDVQTLFCKPELLISIDANNCVLNALKTMVDKKVSGLAVVDKDLKQNPLVGNFSASDFRHLEFCNLSDLSISIREYLKKHSPLSLAPLAVSQGNVTITDVISIFSALEVHRLWVIDSADNSMPTTGTVTLSDVLNVLRKIRD